MARPMSVSLAAHTTHDEVVWLNGLADSLLRRHSKEGARQQLVKLRELCAVRDYPASVDREAVLARFDHLIGAA